MTPEQRARLFYFDEMGVDYRIYRQFARSRRGVKVYQKVSGSRTGRANVMALYGGNSGDKLLAPFCFEGSCDANLINTYFETQVLKDASLLPKRSIIILDNAAFHKGSRLQEIVEKAGHALFFLPPILLTIIPSKRNGLSLNRFSNPSSLVSLKRINSMPFVMGLHTSLKIDMSTQNTIL